MTVRLKVSSIRGPSTEHTAGRLRDAVVDRAYRKYMRKMVQLGLVREKDSVRWRTFDIPI